MSALTLTLRLSRHRHARLKALTEFGAETRFLARAQRGAGRVARGLALPRKAQAANVAVAAPFLGADAA